MYVFKIGKGGNLLAKVEQPCSNTMRSASALPQKFL